jgi:hypothetical protein
MLKHKKMNEQSSLATQFSVDNSKNTSKYLQTLNQPSHSLQSNGPEGASRSTANNLHSFNSNSSVSSTNATKFHSSASTSYMVNPLNLSSVLNSANSSASSPSPSPTHSAQSIDSPAILLREKLSISSADSSSTPNSPPPNYEEVFETKTTTARFNNCFENKTYCQPSHLAISSSLSNLRNNFEENQRKKSLQEASREHNQAASASSQSARLFQKNSKKEDQLVFAFPEIIKENETTTNRLTQQTPPPPPPPLSEAGSLPFNSASFHSVNLPPPPRPPLPVDASDDFVPALPPRPKKNPTLIRQQTK